MDFTLSPPPMSKTFLFHFHEDDLLDAQLRKNVPSFKWTVSSSPNTVGPAAPAGTSQDVRRNREVEEDRIRKETERLRKTELEKCCCFMGSAKSAFPPTPPLASLLLTLPGRGEGAVGRGLF